ncbi:MAG: DUF6600 domain-containing protein [Spirosomataceae bacterium]
MTTFNSLRSLLLTMGIMAALLVSGTSRAQYDNYQPSYDEFYNELSPYGDWMDYPSYGRVWRPQAGPDFQPYGTNGRWEMTEYGNTWVSDYPWGWAPFHYGRWLYDDYYGWIWVPGYEWGPAWVSWRSGGGYYGWAPLGPGMGIDISINIPYNYWTFVPDIYIRSPRVYSYCVPRNRISGIYGGTSYLNNYYRYNNRSYAFGPHRQDIERITRSRINVYRADDLYRNGRNNSYRRDNGRYAQVPSGRNNGYNNRPDYNDRNRWDNRRDNNPNWGQNSPRYDNRNEQNRPNDRFDNNAGQRERERIQQPERTMPESNRREDRPYQAPERGNARRTWGDNGGTGSPSPSHREAFPQGQSSGQRRTWSDNGNSNQQGRSNREFGQQRSQEGGQRQAERSNEGQGHHGRRGRD